MRIVSANITGSLILNGVDVTDSLVSSSIISSSVNSKLNSLQSSTSSLNSFTSSYSTGSFTGSFKGDGTNLYNIPASGVTGLQLDKIASGAVTASVSENGFNVNSNVSITGSIVASGTSLVSGSSQINITGTTEYSTFSSSISTSIGSLSSSVASTTNTLSSSVSSSIGSLSSSVATTTSGLSSSLSSSIGSLSSSVATTTVGTKNRVDSIEVKTGSYATTGSNTFIGTENITGNLTVTGSVIVSSGSAVYNSSLNLTDTSSLTLNSGSNLYVYDTGIISGTFKGSVTGSLGINGNVSITGSIVASGTSLVSGSSQIDITSTTNYTTFSSSVSSSIGNLSSSVATNTSGLAGRITTIEGRYATTGSNTFVGSQVITGSLYITNDMIVQGSSSLQNITASAVSIGTNTVILNTDTPAVRFAGVSVQDSGSNAGVTGSIFWDGLCNRWVYSNPSGIGYSGGMLLSGPRTSTLGSESPLTCNYIAKSGGGDHLYDSCIIDDGTNVTVSANLIGTGTGCFTGTLCANYLYSTTNVVANDTLFTGGNIRKLNNNQCIFFRNAAGDVESIISGNGNVGIGTCTPTSQLHIIGNSGGIFTDGLRIGRNGNTTQYTILNHAGGATNLSSVDASGNNIPEIYFNRSSNGTTMTSSMMINKDGNVGIGTTTPAAEFQVNKNCDVVMAISNCVNVTSGNRGALAFYNCATSTVAIIRAAAVTDNVGTELQFHTRPAAGSLTQVLTLESTGVATFACQVCASSLSMCGNVILSRASTSAGTNVEFRTAGTLNWYLGTRGLTNNNFYIVNEGLSGLSNLIIDATTGTATFACQVCSAGTFMSNVGTATSTYGFTHCGSNGYYGRFGVPNGSYMYLETNANSGVYIDSTTRTNYLSVNAGWSSGGGANQPLQVKSGVAGAGIWVESCSSDAGGYINMNGNCMAIGQSYRTSGGYNDIIFQTAGTTRMIVRCAGNVEVQTGIVSPMFMIERNSAFGDITTGQYLDLNDSGTVGLNAKFHQQFAPYVNSGEGMTWNYARVLVRMTSTVSTFSQAGIGCIRNATYFYGSGWLCFGTHVSISNTMDSARGFKWVVMPWFSYSDFANGVDVPGLGLYNQYSDASLRIGAVYLQYKT